MNDLSPGGLITELDLGSARGGKAGVHSQPLEIDVVRGLGPADLPAILNPPPVSAPAQTVAQLRHSHHRLAELIATGRPLVEVSAITGYSQSYISILQGDSAFKELLTFYAGQKEAVFVDAMVQLRDLGIDAMQRLREKVHDPNEPWTKRELAELVEMAVAKPAIRAAERVQPGPQANLNLEVRFVGVKTEDGHVGTSLDGAFVDVTNPTERGQ